MGMVDSNLVFAEAQAVTTVGDNASTNTIDTGFAANGDAGQTGENLWLQALCSTTATSGGGATMQPVLQSSPDNATWTDAAGGLGPVTALASLTAGAILWQVQIPVGLQRYLRISWRIGTAALTAGKFDAWITNTIERNVIQASGFTVS